MKGERGNRTFIVHGADDKTGAEVRLPVTLGSVLEASTFAASRGVKVTAVYSESGHVYYPTESGGFRRNDEKVPTPPGESMLRICSVAVPLVGVIADSMRLARRDSSGTRLILLALLGAGFWWLAAVSLILGTAK